MNKPKLKNALVQLAFVVFLAIAVSGCGAYAPYSYWGGNDSGYSDTRLAENRWTVLYRGNQLTDPEKVTDFTLLRAAELTVTNGFRYRCRRLGRQDSNQHSCYARLRLWE